MCSFLTEKIQLGSPPRVRGKDLFGLGVDGSAGITPACAGKSFVPVYDRIQRRDHPRVCGEKRQAFMTSQSVVGSPPRVRGKGLARKDRRLGIGITPACAGKRQSCCALRRAMRDHPRVCGEKTKKSVENKGISNAELCDFI